MKMKTSVEMVFDLDGLLLVFLFLSYLKIPSTLVKMTWSRIQIKRQWLSQYRGAPASQSCRQSSKQAQISDALSYFTHAFLRLLSETLPLLMQAFGWAGRAESIKFPAQTNKTFKSLN